MQVVAIASPYVIALWFFRPASQSISTESPVALNRARAKPKKTEASQALALGMKADRPNVCAVQKEASAP
jgi:hypothetical protein